MLFGYTDLLVKWFPHFWCWLAPCSVFLFSWAGFFETEGCRNPVLLELPFISSGLISAELLSWFPLWVHCAHYQCSSRPEVALGQQHHLCLIPIRWLNVLSKSQESMEAYLGKGQEEGELPWSQVPSAHSLGWNQQCVHAVGTLAWRHHQGCASQTQGQHHPPAPSCKVLLWP